MPNIREVGANEVTLRPSEVGVDSRAAAARRLGGFFNQAGEATAALGGRIASIVRDVGNTVEQFETSREISKGAADGAQLLNTLTQQWNERAKNADPNDPTVAQKFRDEVLAPQLDQFRSGFNTERSGDWAEHFVEKLRNHMFEKTTSDMASLAGQAVAVNAQKMINNLASTVASDPSSLDFVLDAVGHKVGGMADSSPNLTPEAAARIKDSVLQDAKQTIVKAAISGMIQKNPNVDLDALQKKYGDYINGAEMKMFQKAAQTQAKADMIANKQLETYRRQQQEHAANDAMTKALTDNVTTDANGKLTINPNIVQQTLDIARKFPEAGTAPARAMIDFVQAQQNKELKAVDNPAVVTDLSNRLFDPDKPLTVIDLMRARTKGEISDHTYTQLNGMVKELETTPLKGPVYQDTMKAAHSALVLSDVGMPGKDDVGEANYAKFVQTFLPQYMAKYRAGTLPENALDVKDPDSMISKAMQPYRRTLTERINDYVSVLGDKGAVTQGSSNARTFGGVPVPAALAGIAAIRRNPATGEWKDETTGKIYNKDGTPK